MTAFANLAFNDGQATPVSHTFSKRKVGDGDDVNTTVAMWEDRSSGIAVGFNKISQFMRFPGTTKGAPRSTKVSVKIQTPVLENVSNSTVTGIAPAPTVAYANLGTIEVVLPERSSSASRADHYAYIKGFVLSDEFKNAVIGLDPVMG
jgi:hypothetical protein